MMVYLACLLVDIGIVAAIDSPVEYFGPIEHSQKFER
jgi:hypothetical protein